MKSRELNPVQAAFAPILGRPAWGVQKGQGSFLTFEFGEPSLSISEPIVASANASPKVAAALARRVVKPHGQWHLWIYVCDWCVTTQIGELFLSDDADVELHRAARALDGQKLVSVAADPSGVCIFSFDLGGRLETKPYGEENEEQWLLYSPEDKVFSFRANGTYFDGPSDTATGEETWRPLIASG